MRGLCGTHLHARYLYIIYFIKKKKNVFFYSSRRIADAIHDCNIYRVYCGDGVEGGGTASICALVV